MGVVQKTKGKIVAGGFTGDIVADAGSIGTAELAAQSVTMAKLARGTNGQVVVANTSADPAYVTMSGDATLSAAGAITVGAGAITNSKLAVPKVSVLSETHTAATFTDGGSAVGTKTMTGTIPAGAVVLGTKVLVPAGFAGDVSAALTIGDGTDVDRYNTGTIDIFTTAATGVASGVPSGQKLQVAAVSPVLTVTSNADITPVIAEAGSVTVNIYYIATV
jgi:hypothetical protein